MDHVLAKRVDAPPTVYLGLTSAEITTIALGSLALYLPPMLTVGFLTGNASVFLGITPMLSVATVFIAGKILARIKRGKPQGFFAQRIMVWLHRKGLRRTKAMRLPHGDYSLGRSRPVLRQR